MVGIHRQHGAADHCIDLSAVVLKLAADKAAFVLDGVADGFLHIGIFLGGLRCAEGGGKPPAEIFP